MLLLRLLPALCAHLLLAAAPSALICHRLFLREMDVGSALGLAHVRTLATTIQVLRKVTTRGTGAACVLAYPVSSPLPTPPLRICGRLLLGAPP